MSITLVTGATGFVGSHVARKLVERGERVRVLTRSQSSGKLLAGLTAERVIGDLTDSASLRVALAGCKRVYHVAADYRLWVADPKELYRNNVEGTRNLLEAAKGAGVERIVYTSTVGALGFTANGTPANEETPVSLHDMIGHYKRSKFLAEKEALAFAKAGLPIVVVNPSTPIGTGDIKPTPTGQIFVEFLNRRMPAYVETGLNLVDVEDVAEGHLLAMEKGRIGERYILGNRNLTFKEVLQILAELTGLPAPKVRLPRPVAMILGGLSSGVAWFSKRPPRIPIEAVRMARKKMFFDAAKAVEELGLPQTPIEEACAKAVGWFRANGYVQEGKG